MQKLKLTRVHVSDKDKNNVPLMGKFGPYVRVGLQAEQYGSEWLSGFAKSLNDFPATAKQGDEIEVEVEKKESNGKAYLNFRIPKEEDKVMAMLKELDSRLKTVEANQRKQFELGPEGWKKMYPPRTPGPEETLIPQDPPEAHIDPDDIPF